MLRRVTLAFAIVITAVIGIQGQTRRPLAIEDYYRVLTVTNPQIADDGKTVRFSVTTRVESDNSTKTETFTVPTDGSAAPTKVDAAPAGRGGRAGGAGGRVTSPDGLWIARTQEKPRPKDEPKYASDFEKRHQERFKGVTFDWKDFQRDGSAFPAADPTAQPALQVVLQPASGDPSTTLGAGTPAPRTLVDQDLRPSGLTWHPNGKLLAFTADPEFRNELKYDHADLWTVTTDGDVKRLTNDGAVHSDIDFSPDGKYLSYVRSFGTDAIIKQKLNHGGPRDLYIRPADGAGNAHQPHGGVEPRARQHAMVAGFALHLLHR
jgi:Tol biopolymer transport system component